MILLVKKMELLLVAIVGLQIKSIILMRVKMLINLCINKNI